MKKIIVIAIVLVASLCLKAQNKINGKVLELSQDGEIIPIYGANVYWEGTSVGTTSNFDGVYSIQNPKTFPANLSVSYVGYTFVKKEIVDDKYIFYLESIINLDEVDVKGKEGTTKFSTISSINMQTLSSGELEKAACCNLSESFSTNGSVDVNFSDAISGAKRIQMLGLDGIYTQITQENTPLIRGLSSSFGLNYVPGSWIESIQIIKGSGSVVNGFDSFTGQINLEYLTPNSAPLLYWNGYTNACGKIENNLMYAKKKGSWKSNLFTHFSFLDNEVDENNNGFMDMPKFKQFNILNRWKYYGNDKFKFSIIAKGLVEERLGGAISNADSSYIVDIQNDLIEFSTKTGFIYDIGKSIGLQTSFRVHNQNAVFGINRYMGSQESAYLNLINDTYLGNSAHKLKYGVSYYADRFTESFNGNISNEFKDKIRVDLITGLFSEYSLNSNEMFKLTIGLRADYYNNSDKLNYLPRINMKYNTNDKTAFRLSAGRAFRIPNILVENVSMLASNRQISIDILNPELAWNYGFNFTHCFYFLNREGTINTDLYRTVFENQIVVDIEEQGKLSFYNLSGNSYSNSFQLDFSYELFDRFDVTMSHKINDVMSTFSSDEKSKPLVPKTRSLINFSYNTNFEKWKFNFNANYIGKSRIPSYNDNKEDYSEPFSLYNSQITRKLKDFDVYLGVENIFSYTQKNPILSADSPNASNFDASLIYAPTNGRMLYFGFRYKLN